MMDVAKSTNDITDWLVRKVGDTLEDKFTPFESTHAHGSLGRLKEASQVRRTARWYVVGTADRARMRDSSTTDGGCSRGVCGSR